MSGPQRIPQSVDDFEAGKLTKGSLTYVLERFLIEEAQRPGPDGFIDSRPPARDAGVKDLVESLAARFGL